MAEVLGFRVWVDGGPVDRDSFVTPMYFACTNRSDLLGLRVGARVRRSAPRACEAGGADGAEGGGRLESLLPNS
eukprot:529641-Prymnesium_polylepis.1